MQQLTHNPTRQKKVERLLEAIGSAVEGSVLVFGSLPPRGHDLDLLARGPEHDRISRLLRAEGYVRCGTRWASFEGGSALCVELVPAETWNIAAPELQALYSEARPLEGATMLVTPAPHHSLLIAARRVARGGRRLDQKVRDRVIDALAEDPDAWSTAEARAGSWRARSGLRLLREEYERGSPPPFVRTRAKAEFVFGALVSASGRERLSRSLRRKRKGTIVAFSGLDGAGKSFQALSLRQALQDVGVEAGVVWPPAGNFLYQMPKPVKRMLFGVLDRTARGRQRTGPGETRSTSDGSRPAPAQNSIVTQLLATMVAFAHVASLRRGARRQLRRGGVVIYDRYALDSAVYVRYRWGRERRLPFQRWLIGVLARTPARSYFLDVAPETAFARKGDFPLENLRARAALYREERERFSATRVDGERPREELSSEIAAEVWQALS